MNEREQAYWRLLDVAEDYLRYRERVPHDAPPEVTAPVVTAPPTTPTPDASRSERGAGAKRPGVALPGGGWDGSDERSVRLRRLGMLEERVHACSRCALHAERHNAVPGEGVLDPLVMVVGEGPGADEDHRGLPFVGRAGQFLDKWLEAIELSRTTNAYITNVVKCRPPENRDPRPAESDACIPYLKEQVDLIRPKAILTVGRIASGLLIGSDAGIGSLRGRTYYYNGIPLIPTYHPSGVLRNPELKRPVWEDLKRLHALLNRDAS